MGLEKFSVSHKSSVTNFSIKNITEAHLKTFPILFFYFNFIFLFMYNLKMFLINQKYFFSTFVMQYRVMSILFFTFLKKVKIDFINNVQFEIFIKNDSLKINKYFFLIRNILNFFLIDLIGDLLFFGVKQYNVVRAFFRNIFYNFSLIITRYSLSKLFYSISNYFFCAQWVEREAKDLFGFYFIFNKDLRRLITDYGFRGYPLLKTFPVSGYYEVKRNDLLNTVSYRPLKLFNKNLYVNQLKNVL